MNKFELGWVVGFLEGEGTFGCTGRTRSSARVQAWQVQKEPLKRLANYTKVGKVYGPYPGRRGAEAPYFSWYPSTLDSARLMKQLRPFMSPKRQTQIDTVLARHGLRKRRDYQALSRYGNAAQKAAGNPGQKQPRNRRCGSPQLQVVGGRGYR